MCKIEMCKIVLTNLIINEHGSPYVPYTAGYKKINSICLRYIGHGSPYVPYTAGYKKTYKKISGYSD